MTQLILEILCKSKWVVAGHPEHTTVANVSIATATRDKNMTILFFV